jgi:pyrroline-5-carboxylate reductase
MNDSTRIFFLGGGQMGEAMIAGILAKGLVKPSSVSVSDPLSARCDLLRERYGIAAKQGHEGAAGAGIVVIAVKPQVLGSALAEFKPSLERGALVISIVTGASLQGISSLLGSERVVRVMPNTPAMAGRGMSVWTSGKGADAEAKAETRAVLRAMGEELEVADEAAIDKATAVSGSGPAYALLFIEALADAAVAIGLSRDEAILLASRTVGGTAEYLAKTGEHPAVLRNRVTSPGGTTAAALSELEAGGLRSAVDRAVRAAYARALELGKR